jgi:hypothetical protein
MMKNESAIPKYKINWVRVYQDPNDDLQKVGCSTPERPTRKYIEAHENSYKQMNDVSLGLCVCVVCVLCMCGLL